MRSLFLALFIAVLNVQSTALVAAASKDSIFDFSGTSLKGEPVALSKYKGRVLLIVNTASKCGFTPQYFDLEQLYKAYRDRGLEILAFPSNDFAGQEPLGNNEIKKFCSLNYGVTFPLFARGSVKGAEQQPLFKYLTKSGNNALEGEIEWNFEKFIVSRNGILKARFGSFVNPQSSRIKSVIEELLSEKAAS